MSKHQNYVIHQYYMIHSLGMPIPWYGRMLGIVGIPYHLVRYVITGELIIVPWPWRW